MVGPTYSLHAIVLRKTKLGESDLILTLLAEDGRQVRAVAKGARKPNSPFSSRLEIFAEVEALMASGRVSISSRKCALSTPIRASFLTRSMLRHALLWWTLHRASRSLTLRRRRCSRFSLRRLATLAPAMPRRRWRYAPPLC